MTIFCDFDGTIVDPSLRYYRAHCAALGDVQPTITQKEYWDAKRSAVSEKDILTRHYGGDIPSYHARRIELLENSDYLAYDTLIPGVIDALALLATNHHTLILASLRAHPSHLQDELNTLGIASLFSHILTATPDPDPITAKTTLIKPYAQPGDWIVGDTEADIGSGTQLHLITCAVTTGIRSHSYLEALNPTHLLTSISQLPALL